MAFNRQIRRELTGIRTVLTPRSEIHTQSSSVTHVSQCLSRICLAFMPWATSRSLCWLNGVLERAVSNPTFKNEPWTWWDTLVRFGGHEGRYQNVPRLIPFVSDNEILVEYWYFHQLCLFSWVIRVQTFKSLLIASLRSGRLNLPRISCMMSRVSSGWHYCRHFSTEDSRKSYCDSHN